MSIIFTLEHDHYYCSITWFLLDSRGLSSLCKTIVSCSRIYYFSLIGSLNLVPPSLVSRTQQEKWTLQLGSSLELYCNASGNPEPNVTWTGETRVNGIVLPDGTVTEHFVGNVLTLLNVSAMHHGKYICHASNGLKPDAYAEYTVNVPRKFMVCNITCMTGIISNVHYGRLYTWC